MASHRRARLFHYSPNRGFFERLLISITRPSYYLRFVSDCLCHSLATRRLAVIRIKIGASDPYSPSNLQKEIILSCLPIARGNHIGRSGPPIPTAKQSHNCSRG
jgi:hypothetical protein